MIQVGNIIQNLIPTESVIVTKVQPLGRHFSISYKGVNTNKASSVIIDAAKLETLEVVADEGKFNFKGNPEKFKLFAEAERIKTAYQFDPLFAINCSVVDPLPHQVEAVYKFLLPQPRIRFLLADDTGAGKTIMTGLLIKEMLMRKMVERILIVTPGGLTKQWQEDEMGVKFNLPFTLVNSQVFNSDPTIFQTHDRLVASIDLICRDKYMKVLENTNWDLVIFDEAHKLSAYEYGLKTYRSRRYEAALMLSQRCEHVLLLTATPHRGRQDTFKRLLQLLDEDIFATADIAADRVKELSQDGLNKFFIRRLKEDMKDWEGNPLYVKRSTRTVSYQLTPEEKKLYDAVTKYLTKRKEEAISTKNIHVTLALAVMQRRLVSSIYAIKNTLQRRWTALQELVDELDRNPALWSQKEKLEELVDYDNVDDYEDLDDDEKDALDAILCDPKKLKWFTTASSPKELKHEAQEVKTLYEMANNLYMQNQEEKKYQELKHLLKSQGVVDGEKLVLFTEHKDTLLYLQDRLKNNGYKVTTIHGGMSVDERRESQVKFMTDQAQILIATDAAGEGINLQFCRLLINWDIPWNPNRLEQRMGRVHRYGQKRDVLVFNMVADNTREGQVLAKLLQKLDNIREDLGDDRVYDVIQDVLKGISLEDIISSVFNGQPTQFDAFIDQDKDQIRDLFKKKIEENTKSMAISKVDFKDAQLLKEDSDEKRLQPIYIRLFFEKAFRYLGGEYEQVKEGIYRINKVPAVISDRLRDNYKIYSDNVTKLLFCFDKHIFLDYSNASSLMGKAHYINPGNPLFDCLVDTVRDLYRDEMMKGTVLVSPDDRDAYLAFYVKNQITDNRPSKEGDNVANENLALVCKDSDGNFSVTSPAKLIDLDIPTQYAKEITPPEVEDEQDVMAWSFEKIAMPLFESTKQKVEDDNEARRQYLEEAFNRVIEDLDGEINELQGKTLMNDNEKLQEKLQRKYALRDQAEQKRQERLHSLEKMVELQQRTPEVLGCAYVVPLNQMEYKSHFGMSRDDEVEAIAMNEAMEYEKQEGRIPTDVSKDNVGYDIRSTASDGQKRYIEVKGRAATDGVMLSENEWNRLTQLGKRAWLYIVTDCKTHPTLHIINDPGNTLDFEKTVKGVQYYLPLEEWKAHENLNQ